MKSLHEIKKLYFIGIGGIGMSALARYFAKRKIEIFGYDKVNTELTKKLETEGMTIHYEDDPIWIPEGIDMVVYTPAIPKSHKELNWFRDNEFTVMKRAEMLGLISRNSKALCIAGTHGKTTTSSMLSHILTFGKTGATAIIGGIMTNYQSNFINGDGDLLVLEADEYDRSFLHLEPSMSAVLSLDPDHLDIYNDFQNMIKSFEAFMLKSKRGAHLFLRDGILERLSSDSAKAMKDKGIKILEFGADAKDLNFKNLRIEHGRQVFDLNYKGEKIFGFESKMPGQHNLENALVAIGMAKEAGMTWETIKEGLKSFEGIKRRFEMLYESKDIVVIDDYAHHPTELKACIQAARSLYPNRKLTGIFQPHLFSRTNDFKVEFALALDGLDELILMDIYPARELPMKGVSSKLIFDRMKLENKVLCSKEAVLKNIGERDVEVLLILGAGDIDAEIPKILEKVKSTEAKK